MLDFVEHNCLSQIQMVNESTRCNYIVDLVLVNQENLVENVRVGEHLLSCDHRLVRLDLRAQTRIAENKILVTNFKSGFERIRHSLTIFQLISNIDVEESWQDFKARLLTEQNKFVQSCEKRRKVKDPPWFNTEIKFALQKRNLLYRRQKDDNSAENSSRQYEARRRIKKFH